MIHPRPKKTRLITLPLHRDHRINTRTSNIRRVIRRIVNTTLLKPSRPKRTNHRRTTLTRVRTHRHIRHTNPRRHPNRRISNSNRPAPRLPVRRPMTTRRRRPTRIFPNRHIPRHRTPSRKRPTRSKNIPARHIRSLTRRNSRTLLHRKPKDNQTQPRPKRIKYHGSVTKHHRLNPSLAPKRKNTIRPSSIRRRSIANKLTVNKHPIRM